MIKKWIMRLNRTTFVFIDLLHVFFRSRHFPYSASLCDCAAPNRSEANFIFIFGMKWIQTKVLSVACNEDANRCI